MTYCAALRVNDVVHLIADSAVTSGEVDAAPAEKETPFGEPYTPENGRLTQDGAIKLFEIEGDAFSFAGKVKSGIALLRRYLMYRKKDLSKKSSFELSVADLAGHPDVTMLGVLRESGSLLIIKGTPKTEPEIEQIDQFVSIGANAQIRTLFDARLLAVRDEWGKQAPPAACLALLTATGIATSVKHGTFRHGVGGAFNGITASPNGLVWQQDHLFVIRKDDVTSAHIAASIVNRKNWFITRYKIGEKAVAGKSILTPFDGASISTEDADNLRREQAAVLQDSLYPIKTGKFSFVSTIVQTNGHAHVINMQRNQRHELLEITPPVIYTGIVNYGISLAPEFLQHLGDPSYADRTCFEINRPALRKRQLKFSR